MRLAILNLVPTPYREPLYRRLSQTPDLQLRVFYMQPRDSLRGWSDLSCPYEAVKLKCLTSEPFYSVPFFGVLNPGLIGELRRFSPDCLIVHGYSYLPQMQAVRWAIRQRRPFLLWADSNSHQIHGTGLGARLKRMCLDYVCRHAAGALTIGSLNEKFWRHYGVEPERQFRSPLAVDNEFFRTQAAIWRRRKVEERKALGLPSGRLLLYVGRFTSKKNLEMLLRALGVFGKNGGQPVALVLVGDGPERPRLEGLIHRLGIQKASLFGFQPQQELPKFYGTADALILPSRVEPWGLVVNEAMAAGLPVLLSRSVGCLPDLLEEGNNGLSFDETDLHSLAACLRRFSLLSQEELLRMGSRSAQLISRWSYAESLAGIERALEAVLKFRRDLHPAAAEQN